MAHLYLQMSRATLKANLMFFLFSTQRTSKVCAISVQDIAFRFVVQTEQKFDVNLLMIQHGLAVLTAFSAEFYPLSIETRPQISTICHEKLLKTAQCRRVLQITAPSASISI